MIKYFLVASALKGFSSTTQTRALYRWLGNAVGGRGRTHEVMPEYYSRGVRKMLEFSRKYGVFKDGGRILEVGTGWMHWETITMSLFYDIQAVLFDVWDNRQLNALKHFIAQFGKVMQDWDEVPATQKERAQSRIELIRQAGSFQEIYDRFGFQYLVEPTGSLRALADNSFDVVVSARVLEHIGRDTAAQFARDCYRTLKPGGFSLQSICIGDHLYAYDTSASPKQYLAYSDATWKRWFENQVQYINRIQKSEWLRLFEEAGLKLVESESTAVDLTGLDIAPEYKTLSASDLECHTLRMLHQKAQTSGAPTQAVPEPMKAR